MDRLRCVLLVLCVQLSWTSNTHSGSRSLSMSFFQEPPCVSWCLGTGGYSSASVLHPHEEAVAGELDRLARNEGVDFVLSLGDHFYFDGVKSVDDPRFKEFPRSVLRAAVRCPPHQRVGGRPDDRHRGVVWEHVRPGRSRQDPSTPQPQSSSGAGSQINWPAASQTMSWWPVIIRVVRRPSWTHFLKFNVTVYLSGHDHNIQFIREDDGSSYAVSGSGTLVTPATTHKGSFPLSWQLYSSLWTHRGGAGLLPGQRASHDAQFMQTDGKCVYQAELQKRTP
ncbi:hypothetical protein KUCAC02_017210 [Chaenocephalus aceratus]|uniref:Uncharacterized protein n=1 Tax=Chaenocephalus aceratus TaxID=36190 RepID=A0ACB9W1W1_CHAAC|nr:hypothetical protein KUCAC02_017210 [Chaenocephalus aceratus]